MLGITDIVYHTHSFTSTSMKTKQQSHEQLTEAIGVKELYLKREDLHKYGSHKGRSIPFMIKSYFREGMTDFVISSSGNAAIAAIHTASRHNQNNPGREIALTILIGQNIDEKKKKIIESLSNDPRISIRQVERPKQEAFQIDKEGKAKTLRQSTDDRALEGYITLAEELAKIPDLEAVFIPTSSGTTAQALAQTFIELQKPIQIHVVQTATCHPIAEAFDTPTKDDVNTSLASAIVDNVAHRKNDVVQLIKQTNGSGWIVDNEQIMNAMGIVSQLAHIDISPNSALSVAGLQKAISSGISFTGPVACLITGP